MTPLRLALQKCFEYLGNDDNRTLKEKYHGVAIILMKSDDTIKGVDENVLGLAVNFPVILLRILERHPEFYQSKAGLSFLARALNEGLHYSYCTAGWVELMLRQSANMIVMDFIEKDRTFLEGYTNLVKETPLHTAAKLGKTVVVRTLMRSG